MRLPCAGAPWPSRAARTSHAPLAPPEPGARPPTPRRARRSAPLTEVCAHCSGACTFFRHHTAPERDAPGKTLHREARAAARRARRPPSTLSVTRAGLLCSLHADCKAALPVLNHSARVLRCAPAPSRLHDADPALHEARAWHAARALRHPFSVLSSLPAHSAEHMQGTQGTCARRAVPAQRCSPHPATVACLT